jgi:NAD+ synthase (glutamine-hydrolysing)
MIDETFSTMEAMGFLRVAVAAPTVQVADIAINVRATIEVLDTAAAQGCHLVAFPELGITSYSCADLFSQSCLREHALAGLRALAEATKRLHLAAVVGLPLEIGGRLFNCAALLCDGAILGLVPKTFLPTTQEYYEQRWFSSARASTMQMVAVDGQPIPFGADLLFAADNLPDAVIGIEICEDLWSAQPPSGDMALAGATLFVNPSASVDIVGKAHYRQALVEQQSARCLAVYLYAGAGPGESTMDVVYGGHGLIAENGVTLAETERFQFTSQMALADIDLHLLTQERLRNSSFSAARPAQTYRRIPFTLPIQDRPVSWVSRQPQLRRPLSTMPFVPSDPITRDRHCEEVFIIQATGLAKRLNHTGITRVILGLSGGVDSTLALLVALRAFDLLGLPPAGITAVLMPGAGTSSRTHAQAERLAQLAQVTLRTIPIAEAVRQHLAAIGHDERQTDRTYENAQARERTQILMDLANHLDGLAVGTGDLSELALGWCTYNGDQMSMYHVNAGVPKTLVQHVIRWCAERLFTGEITAVLHAVVATPITPELVPLSATGEIRQETEQIIGPYLLHDFFLFYGVRYGFSPHKILYLAIQAYGDHFTPTGILHWLGVFYQRFFASQFKRSAMPDGPKVGAVALSPRGDWRMSSDAVVTIWQQEVAELTQRFAPPTEKHKRASRGKLL